MRFPTLCVDDFYKNPEQIRDFALSLEYSKPEGIYPGERTKYLHEIDKKLFQQFCEKLFSLFFNYKVERCDWQIETRFQKTYSFTDDPKNLINSGWDHLDNNVFAAGIIYLNKNNTIDSGTTISKLTKDIDVFDYSIRDKMYHDRLEDIDKYKNALENHKKHFEDTIIFKNVFNRMICYDSSQWHRETNLFYENEPRLTQVFFIHDVKAESFPVERCMSYPL